MNLSAHVARGLALLLPALALAACTPTPAAPTMPPSDTVAAATAAPEPTRVSLDTAYTAAAALDRPYAILRFPYLTKPIAGEPVTDDHADVVPTATAGTLADATGAAGGAAAPVAASPPPAGAPCAGIVQRDGRRLVLDGRPVFLFGVNATMLMDPEVKEDQVEPLVAALGTRGVNTVRVWFFHDEDPDRFARLLDTGARHGVRFVVTLADNVFKGRDWFGSKEDEKRYRPHLARTVARFKDRPEIAAWELINEPNCGDKHDQECLDTIKGWLRARAAEVKAIDACHLVSTGMIGAGNYEEEETMYRRVHREPTIDIASAHRRSTDESKKERATAEEIDRPLLYGEIYDQGYDDGCNPLSDDALPRRAERIIDDLRDVVHQGAAGYLLWDFAPGKLQRTNGKPKDYCNKYGFALDDPLWGAIEGEAGGVPAVPWHEAVIKR